MSDLSEVRELGGFDRLFPGGLPRLVMFDLDGTLVDSVPDLAAPGDPLPPAPPPPPPRPSP